PARGPGTGTQESRGPHRPEDPLVQSSQEGNTAVVGRRTRRLEKRFEREMFALTGGKPIMALLRHSDGTLETRTKDRYHNFLGQQLQEQPPTAEGDPAAANELYDRCGIWPRGAPIVTQ